MKRVRYFALDPAGAVQFGKLPNGTRDRGWYRRDQVQTVPLVNEAIRPILFAALENKNV